MYTSYKIWDKKEPIKNVSAEDFINDFHILETDDIILILNNVNIISITAKVSIIKGNYNLDINMTAEEVGEFYLNELIKERQEDNQVVEEGSPSTEDRVKALEEVMLNLL